MASMTKKTTVLFDPDRYERLRRVAKARGRSVGDLIRESVEARFGLVPGPDRVRAVEAIGAMSLPVGTWEEMEAETIRGATGE